MKLDKYLRPENSPITRDNVTSSYEFDYKNERGVVSNSQLQNDTIGSANIADNAVTETKIKDGAVTEDKIGSFAVTSSKIGTSAVTEAKIIGSAVTTDKINNLAVTNAKINDFSFSKGTGAINVTSGTLSGVLLGTSQITGGTITGVNIGTVSTSGGTIANALIGTSQITGGTATTLIISGAGGTLAGQHGYDATNKAILIGDGAANQSIYTSSWKAYTPTLPKLTLGNGTLEASYCVSGKLINTRIYIGFGTSTVMSTTTFDFTLPVTSVAYSGGAGVPVIGNAVYFESGGLLYSGVVSYFNVGTARLRVLAHGASYITESNIGSIVPFTWGSEDVLMCQFQYEAA